jgi:putative glycosyltransferase
MAVAASDTRFGRTKRERNIVAPNRAKLERSTMKLSIVATLYRSASTIDEFYRRSVAAAKSLGYEVEVILVNDGSPDESLELALRIQQADPRVVVVDLSRNFGHDKAMMTGLMHSAGDLVFLIDSDLDEEPELLLQFHHCFIEGDCDVVYGYQELRRGDLFERLSGAIYYSLAELLSDEKIPRNVITARLMTREFVAALVEHRDREFLIEQLWSASGFRQVGLPVRKLSISPSTFSFALRASYVVKHITTSSTKLLHLIFYFGLFLSIADVAVILYFLSRYAVSGIIVSGFTSTIVSIWFFGGLIILILGTHGIYIAAIFSETKRRPYTVVRQVYRAPDGPTGACERMDRAPDDPDARRHSAQL